MDDGLVFDTDAATADIIRDDDEYSGVRITLTATLASAKHSPHIDDNIGDPIWPAPRTAHPPKLLGGTITLAGYPGRFVTASHPLPSGLIGAGECLTTVADRHGGGGQHAGCQRRSRGVSDTDELVHCVVEPTLPRAPGHGSQ